MMMRAEGTPLPTSRDTGEHVAIATRILGDLERSTQRALDALDADDSSGFLVAIGARGRSVLELEHAVGTLLATDDGVPGAGAAESAAQWLTQVAAMTRDDGERLSASAARKHAALAKAIDAGDRHDRAARSYQNNGVQPPPTLAISG